VFLNTAPLHTMYLGYRAKTWLRLRFSIVGAFVRTKHSTSRTSFLSQIHLPKQGLEARIGAITIKQRRVRVARLRTLGHRVYSYPIHPLSLL
jgi:hypothetical protein